MQHADSTWFCAARSKCSENDNHSLPSDRGAPLMVPRVSSLFPFLHSPSPPFFFCSYSLLFLSLYSSRGSILNSILESDKRRTSLVVQWLRLRTPNAGEGA